MTPNERKMIKQEILFLNKHHSDGWSEFTKDELKDVLSGIGVTLEMLVDNEIARYIKVITKHN